MALITSGLLLASGTMVLVAALYLLTLAVAAMRSPVPPALGVECTQLMVLIPAHNEAVLIQRCVGSLFRQLYPSGLYRVVVIADNCTDATAQLAADAGAHVMVRHEPHSRGKGQALRWAFDRLLAAHDPPSAIVIVDADSVADENLLSNLEAHLRRGSDVVQAQHLVRREVGGPGAELSAAAFLLFNGVRLAGRSAIGLPACLVGNGMAFRTDVLRRVPWDAFTGVEDLEYTIRLRLAGVTPAYAGAATIWGPSSGGHPQRFRWEGGRFHIMRRRLPLLAKSLLAGRWALLDLALDLAVPSVSLLAVLLASGTALGAGATLMGWAAAWTLAPWLVVYMWLLLRGHDAQALSRMAATRSSRWCRSRTPMLARPHRSSLRSAAAG